MSGALRHPRQRSLHWRRTVVNAIKPITAEAWTALSVVSEAWEKRNQRWVKSKLTISMIRQIICEAFITQWASWGKPMIVRALKYRVQARLRQLAQDASGRELLAANAKTVTLPQGE